ncbi:hypothetical protein [Paracoccus aestuariivivens]|uniref:DUF1834 family protein n=1 Tax=Paracoccus aestuariivivens TaxID=1820333 RepID=A0A6L6J9R1_9RHOB|nr:hypothetical protein [Paracoccus aestuariivivens]MTH78750.1 hypothetical protein [Paracoccus aestuariivivens]
MTQPDTAIDLATMISSITASISAAVPRLQMVEAYPEIRLNLPTPACLVELIELEPVDNPGTEQLAVLARFEAYILVAFRELDAKVQVAKLAAAVAHHVQGERWGLPVEPATIAAIAPSDFEPELDQFEIWAVEWHQTIHIGESVWQSDGPVPRQVLASWSPEIGADYESDYSDIVGGAP